MTDNLALGSMRIQRGICELPVRLCSHDSIFAESFGGFWFEKYLHVQCPVPRCGGSLLEGWEYIDTMKDTDGVERLAGQWWIFCPACGYAKKLEGRKR